MRSAFSTLNYLNFAPISVSSGKQRRCPNGGTMDREDDIQYDGEVLPPEGAPSADYDAATPAVADDVLPDTLVLLPLPGRPFLNPLRPPQIHPFQLFFPPRSWGG